MEFKRAQKRAHSKRGTRDSGQVLTFEQQLIELGFDCADSHELSVCCLVGRVERCPAV